ncbi:MAG TPA: tRNA (adenosine(37)-N6)-threonylcarbamoyltransferase complex ATPase subunit type 1 TsaE [Patescibacteria group bacterium]|nr:tRNA (adenosine(37)-N6)-threonylcarbamoyltransferase complex ATPase subunit type 1 TsaE [Patescibacteria group bacterium]
MEEKEFISRSPQETQKYGEDFARQLKPGDIVSLTGDLGAGKTVFVQGIAIGLGIKGRIISPTFVLVRSHEANPQIQGQRSAIKTFYHMDLYRLEGEESIKNIGLDEFINDQSGVSVIEWAKKHPKLKPNWEIDIKMNEDNVRNIKINKYE